ncbi:MAG: hypothetical protein KF768_01350 [Phycisphaeraceae bacterium]|nr:hypothetical protein [Phycisphaeraceae bacterium]
MTQQAPTDEKRCSLCGKDVSTRTRATDAQGRFICAECLEKARAARPAQQAPAPTAQTGRSRAPDRASGPDDVMSRLVDESLEQAKSGCPNCRAPFKPNQVICVKCGYHREKGAALHTTVQKPKPGKGGKGGWFSWGKK